MLRTRRSPYTRGYLTGKFGLDNGWGFGYIDNVISWYVPAVTKGHNK